MPLPFPTIPTTQDARGEILDFFDRAEALVNLTENLSDLALSQYRDILNNASRKASMRMESLVKSLPRASGNGAVLDQIDTETPAGLRKREQFLRAQSAVYDDWKKEITRESGVSKWGEKRPMWDRSLGTVERKRSPRFIVALRTALEQLGELIRGIPVLIENIADMQEAVPGTARFETRAARKKYGISFEPKARSFKIITDDFDLVTAAKQERVDSGADPKESVESVTDAWLENIIKGMDETARRHANDVQETATGIVSRSQLQQQAQGFMASADNKQQALSIQTHARAGVRRHVSSKTDGAQMMLQVPATRSQDMISRPGVEARAYKVESLREIMEKGKGAADGLGIFPGDQMQLVRVPQNAVRLVEAEALRRRELYTDALKVATASRAQIPEVLAATWRTQITNLGRGATFTATDLKGGQVSQRLAWLRAEREAGNVFADARGRYIWHGESAKVVSTKSQLEKFKAPKKPTEAKPIPVEKPLERKKTNPKTPEWEQWEKELPGGDRSVIKVWTSSGYKDMRIAQINPKAADSFIRGEVEFLSEMLAEAPKYDGTIYRGMHLTREAAEEFLENDIFETQAIASFSRSLSVAKEFTKHGVFEESISVVVEVRQKKSGTWIGALSTAPKEDEVLVPKGVQFKRVRVQRSFEKVRTKKGIVKILRGIRAIFMEID